MYFDPRITVSPNEISKPVGSVVPPNWDDYDTSIGYYISYVFTLSNATLGDSGLYLVTVIAVNPNTSILTNSFKMKYLVTKGEQYIKKFTTVLCSYMMISLHACMG